ncbi:MAG: polyprenyl synthetase family protein [Treponema sp.]|jgi:octaprenyl-diphosphate synthase|nr:polyprenyl synthetase family protein [Treponema sp.]
MDSEYIKRLEKIEERLSLFLPRFPGRSWMDMVFEDSARQVGRDLAASLLEPGWDIVNRGGKRWRPLLLTLICEALGGGDKGLALVPLVEFPHNASLIHDDIEDNSDERRGRPAVHLIYGADTAINSGCFLYFLPLVCIDSWDATAELKNRLYAVWAEHMRRLHLGQAMDIKWHRDFAAVPDPAEYELMCRLKTGSLARLAAVLGVYAGYAGKAGGLSAGREIFRERAVLQIKAFGGAAEKLGVGFQILDDVKNLTTGNPGKKRGDDVVEGKKSLPALLFLNENPGKAPLVERCFRAARAGGSSAPEVEELIGEFEAAGVLEKAGARGLALIGEAMEALANPGGDFWETGNGGEEGPGLAAEALAARRLLAGFTELLR